jgi:hypothetical protein
MERKKEWLDEPDEFEFVSSGLKCKILRCGGHLNGYVGVPETHPLYKVYYQDPSPVLQKKQEKMLTKTQDEVEMTFARCLGLFAGELSSSPDIIFEVHGGVTFSGFIGTDKLWYFGFDTSHYGDYSPEMDDTWSNSVYRNFAYVKAETEKLAKQLAEIEE